MCPLIASVCRYSRPPALSASWRLSEMPSAMGAVAWLTISSRKRLAWRALRAISEMPLLWLSSSSSVMIGRNTSCSSKRYRLVGSCIRTLVSSTNSLVPDCLGFTRLEGADLDADAAGSSCRSVGFNKGEHLLCVSRDLDAAPFAPDHAIAVQDEGAALDAAHLLPVHVLHLHDVELLAHVLGLVGKQVEREAHFRLEALVRPGAVARDAVDGRPGLHEPGMQIAELAAFEGAAGRAVLGVEVQHHTPGLDRR